VTTDHLVYNDRIDTCCRGLEIPASPSSCWYL